MWVLQELMGSDMDKKRKQQQNQQNTKQEQVQFLGVDSIDPQVPVFPLALHPSP